MDSEVQDADGLTGLVQFYKAPTWPQGYYKKQQQHQPSNQITHRPTKLISFPFLEEASTDLLFTTGGQHLRRVKHTHLPQADSPGLEALHIENHHDQVLLF